MFVWVCCVHGLCPTCIHLKLIHTMVFVPEISLTLLMLLCFHHDHRCHQGRIHLTQQAAAPTHWPVTCTPIAWTLKTRALPALL